MTDRILEETDLIKKIKESDFRELDLIAVRLREALIDTVSKTGGHLASNLGIVELTIALHRIFDLDRDRLVWDVGHQTYVHKIISGRGPRFGTLRQLDGLSGFPKRSESPYDAFDSGHSGDSVSAALGYALARDLRHEDHSCIAVIGDGSMTSGEAFEGLNLAGSLKTPLIVILNDNGMSISGNVGGMAKSLQQIRTSGAYLDFKKSIMNLFKEDSRFGQRYEAITKQIKSAVLPGAIFEELGFKYFGPIDGHNIEDLCGALKVAKDLRRPVLLHVVTKKGKGFVSAEKNPTKFHGIGSFDPETATPSDRVNKDSWSERFGEALIQAAEADDRVVAVTAAMTDATGVAGLKKLHPDRVIDVGIAEQNAVSAAAGLALGGMRPIVAIYSTFLQRAYDQIITEVCMQQLPVIFAIDRAGITGPDGETHQGQFDIAFLSSMPNMTILTPSDAVELGHMIEYALKLGTPVAIRYPKCNAPVSSYSFDAAQSFEPWPRVIKPGEQTLIISDGSMLDTAAKAAGILESRGMSTAVANVRIIKPLPYDFFIDAFGRYENIVTIEDGTLYSGFGSAVSFLAAKLKTPRRVLNLGWPDKFIEHGSIGALRERYGLDDLSVADRICSFFGDGN